MSDMEKREAASLLSSLTSDLDPTVSFEGEAGGMAKGALLNKMIYGLAGPAEMSDATATAKIGMYADAIEDLPAWAIDVAIKRWGRGACPAEIEERPKYAFPPAPATLRSMAVLELDLPRRYVRMLENLLAVIPVARALDPDDVQTSTAVATTLRRM